MGNLMIGLVYPPNIQLGSTPVSKVMCGEEQVGPRTRQIRIKITTLDLSGNVSGTPFNKLVTLSYPLSTSIRSSYWEASLNSENNYIEVSVQYLGYSITRKMYNLQKIESTDPTLVYNKYYVKIPKSYITSTGTVDTINFVVQEYVQLKIHYDGWLYYYDGKHYTYPSGDITLFPERCVIGDEGNLYTYEDAGDKGIIRPKMGAVYADGRLADGRLMYISFEPTYDYYGTAHVEDNALIVDKQEVVDYRFKTIGTLKTCVADYARSSKVDLDIKKTFTEVLDTRILNPVEHWENAIRWGLPYFTGEDYAGKPTTRFYYTVYEGDDGPSEYKRYQFDPNTQLVKVEARHGENGSGFTPNHDETAIILKDGIPTWLEDYTFISFI